MTKGIRDRGGVKERHRSAPCGEEGSREDHAQVAGTWLPPGAPKQDEHRLIRGQAHSGHSVTSCQVTEQTSLRPTETQTALMEHLFGAGHLTSFIRLY